MFVIQLDYASLLKLEIYIRQGRFGVSGKTLSRQEFKAYFMEYTGIPKVLLILRYASHRCTDVIRGHC
jgi:hypothetical protein